MDLVRIYLDVCALKRPFDDAGDPRVRLEAEAVLNLLEIHPARVQIIRSPAQTAENDRNPLAWCAERARRILATFEAIVWDAAWLEQRTAELMTRGFRNFDALHLARGEFAGADVFVTTDDRLLRLCQREAAGLKLRALDPILITREVSP